MTQPGPRGQGMARRNYPPRVVGLGLGSLCIALPLYEAGAGWGWWLLLGLFAFAWPHVARWRAAFARDARRAEIRNLLADDAACGFWVVVIGGNALPSVLTFVLLVLSDMATGGPRLFVRGVAVTVTAALATALVIGFDFRPHTSMATVVACLPLLLVFPPMLGWITYDLAHRLAEQRRQFRNLSRRDALSGVSNRKHWDEVLGAEFARVRRHGWMASLLMVDIDHFKAYNDSRGHAAGDEAIREVAGLLESGSRVEDAVARYGGEEFCLLLPGSDGAEARRTAERLRERVARSAGLTVSIGVAPCEPGIPDAAEWLERADRAMYAAKRAGRNCTAVYTPGMGAGAGAADANAAVPVHSATAHSQTGTSNGSG